MHPFIYLFISPLSIVVFVLCWHGDNPKWIGKQFVEVGGWVIKVLLSIGICLTLILGKQSMPGFSCNGRVRKQHKEGDLKIKNIYLSDCPKSQKNKNKKKLTFVATCTQLIRNITVFKMYSKKVCLNCFMQITVMCC